MRVLITGATGKVGSRLARHLARSGHAVRALVRNAQTAADLRDAGLELVGGDLTVPDSLAAAVEGADVVIHCAAFFRGATPDQMKAANTDGTMHLARAALGEGATQFIYLSTSLVYGTGPGRPATEDDLPDPRFPYPRTKLDAERALLALPELDARILRLAFVYGDGDSHLCDWVPTLRAWPTNRRLQLIHHRDVARAVDLLVVAATVRRRTYNLADDEALTAGAALEALGEPALFVPDPPEEVAFQGVMDSSSIRRELGFRPAYPSLRAAISGAAL